MDRNPITQDDAREMYEDALLDEIGARQRDVVRLESEKAAMIHCAEQRQKIIEDLYLHIYRLERRIEALTSHSTN